MQKNAGVAVDLVCTKVVQAADIPDVEINNLLSDCMDIRPVQQTNMDNLIILKTDITLKKVPVSAAAFRRGSVIPDCWRRIFRITGLVKPTFYSRAIFH